MGALNILVPMAGNGARFAEAGHALPKPLIDVRGETMITRVVQNLRAGHRDDHRFVFVCKAEHCRRFDVAGVLDRATGGRFSIVEVEGTTEGAACTALLAKALIDTDDELVIANSDQYVDVPFAAFLDDARTRAVDGLIMTFEASHTKWSYARVRDDQTVIEVAEKKVISPHATVGIYYFRRGRDFVSAAESMIRKNIRHQGEFYVCPVYNEVIGAGHTVAIHPIDAGRMHGMGTPEDLQVFLTKLDEGQVSIA
jgi:NDP-sugar pyrophosphorylase family protein